MRRLILFLALFLSAIPLVSLAAVDTLKGASDVGDCVIYSWEACNSEVSGEDCRRYNGGGITTMGAGKSDISKEKRSLLFLPGWNDTLPDSSRFGIYCKLETDAADRKIFLYPLTTQTFVGTENSYNIGDYPDPDSGATWNHAYLDVGDGDSVNWSSSGGDYTTDVACTTLVTGTSQYFFFESFNRILNYWDTSGTNYGFVLENENVFPAQTSLKTFRTTDGPDSTMPLAVLYYPDSSQTNLRRRRIGSQFNNGRW